VAGWTFTMSFAEFAGYLAAACMLTTFSMKTMVPLRLAGIVTNCLFILYGYLGLLFPVVVLHLILLPLNITRLYQMLQLIKRVREASHGDLSIDWLKPFMSKRVTRKGDILFRKADVAEEMFYVVSGRYRLSESGIDVLPGQVVGELGLLAPENRRTQTLECLEDGELLTISYENVKQLYFQNPQFGFYFLRLATRRLFQNIERLEEELVRRTGAITAP
jgi:CRP/FNR family cyclic AMP-dependent transcriptional regulator